MKNKKHKKGPHKGPHHNNNIENNPENIHGKTQHLKDEWRNLYASNNEKLSKGAQGAFSTQTVAHKDQWRNKINNHKKAK